MSGHMKTGSVAGVSVVIVNYNAGSLLRDCVESALGQAGEIIIVDNASSDASLAGLESLEGDSRLRIVRNRTNLGFAAGCNIGVHASSGSSILFLNPDCVLAPGAVAAMLRELFGGSKVGMVGGLLVNLDGSEQGGGRRAVPTPWRSLVRATGLSRLSHRWPLLFFDFHLHKQPLPEGPIEVEAISGACMLVRRDAMDSVGLLDEQYFMHCEDLDWCMRFRRQGWQILFVPTARVVHQKGSCSKLRPVFVEWHKHRGMVRFYRKFFRHQYPGILMWLVVLGVWQRFFFVAAYLTFQRLLSGEESASQATSSCQRDDHGAEAQLSRQVREAGESAHVGVIGASSMVGRALLPMLINAGRMVHAFSRQPHAEEKGVVWHCLSASPAGACNPELPRIEEWICLAPIKVLMERLDFLEACGARRIVALSSTSRFTKVTSSDPAEQALVRHLVDSEERLAKWAEARGIEWVVLRPTLVYGFGMDRNVSVIACFIRRFGFFPVLGAARGLRQPVHAGDVAAACFAALQRAEAAKHAYNISGAEVLSYREMVERLFSSLGRRPRFVAIPLWAFALAVKLLKALPRFRHWSPAMAERMNQDMAFDHEEAARDLGYAPRPFVPDERDMPFIRK